VSSRTLLLRGEGLPLLRKTTAYLALGVVFFVTTLFLAVCFALIITNLVQF
jgi:hypothetical protein